MRSWILEDGRSPTTVIERCEFLLSDLPPIVPNSNPPCPMSAGLDKGVLCSFSAGENSPAVQMMLWVGGALPGGLIHRWMLVAASYHA